MSNTIFSKTFWVNFLGYFTLIVLPICFLATIVDLTTFINWNLHYVYFIITIMLYHFYIADKILKIFN